MDAFADQQGKVHRDVEKSGEASRSGVVNPLDVLQTTESLETIHSYNIKPLHALNVILINGKRSLEDRSPLKDLKLNVEYGQVLETKAIRW